MEEKEFITIQEVADLLQVHYNTVLKWVLSGDLPAAKLGDSWRIRNSDLDLFFDVRRNKPVESKSL